MLKISKVITLLFCIVVSHAAFAVPVSDIMEIHVVPNVGGTPVTVNLDNIYTDAIPVCTYNLPSPSDSPAIVRINSISSNTITIQLGVLDDAPGATATPGNVHCIIVEEGLHDVNGTPIEARKVLSNGTVGRNTTPNWNSNNGWQNNLEDITSLITHPFVNPVVLGQVITANDPLASVYFANDCSFRRRNIPFSGAGRICVGKHISKEFGTRVDESIGVIIAGTTTSSGASGSTGGFRAGTTGLTIRGVSNSGAPYSQNTVETYSVGILSQLGERGGDGAWAVLLGSDPLANNQINLAIEESLIDNNIRTHTTERVNYLVVTVPTITLEKVVVGGGPRTADEFTLNFTGDASNSGVTGSTNVTRFPVAPGTYTISESNLAQYIQTDLSCTGGSLTGSDLQLTAFDTATCIFTNTFDGGAAAGVNVSGNVFEDLNSNGALNGGEDWANAISVFVNIVDTLNPGVVLQSVQVNPGTGDFSFTAIPPGNYELVISDSQISGSPVAPDEWVFIAPSTGIQTLTVAGTNIAGENFGLFHAPILNLTKTTSTSTVVNTSTGTTADYLITLSNAASLGGNAQSVQISDVLPAGFIFDSASVVITTPATGNCPSGATRNSTINPANGATGTITWGDWTVPAGCEVLIEFSANIPNTVPDATYDNSVSVTTSTSPATINDFDGSLSNDENITVTSAVLTVTKNALTGTVQAGGTGSYQIVVNNTGTATAEDVDIDDVLPANFSYDSTSSITGSHTRTVVTNPTAGAATVNPLWGTFTIPPAGSVVIEFVANINGAVPDGFFQNSVNVVSSNSKIITNYDGNIPENNTDDIEVATASPTTDLSITLSDALNSAIPGNSISYTIDVSNTGSDVVGAGVIDIFNPNIFDVANITWSCAITTGSGVCANAGPETGNISTTVDLTNGSVATFSVTAAPILSNATGTIDNTASVTPPSGTIDSDASNNSALDNNTVLEPTGDLVISKDDGLASVVAGTSTTYTITVQNNGPSDVVGATVTDTFDSTDVNVANVDWTCVINGGSVGACGTISGSGDINTLLDLTAGSSATFTAIVPVLENAVTPLNNDAVITAPATFNNTNTSNVATDTTVISLAQADLEITKITSNGAPAQGENFTYTLTLQNDGTSGATNIVVTDTYPANGFNFVSALAQQGAGADRTFTNNGGSLTWNIPFLPSGNFATLEITANITASGIQTNNAEVTALDQDDPDSTPANGVPSEDDFDSVDVNIGGAVVVADLRITKTDNSTLAVPGSPVVYTIVVTNDSSSPNDVVGMTVEDIFDPVYFDVPNVSWTCSITSGTGVCGSPGPVLGDIVNTTSLDLTIGSEATFVVTAPVLANASGTVSNTVTVTAPTGVTESNPGNNSAVDNNTLLVPEADLSLSNTVDNPLPNIGDLVTFNIEVTNSGPSDATNVTVRDILPSGYTFDLANTSATQGSYDNATGDWTIGTLTMSAPVQTLSLAAIVNSTGEYLNNAQVWTSDAADIDSTPANDVATEDDSSDDSITLTESDLSITNEVDNLTPVPGENVTFTLTVSNAGPSIATSVVIEDRLPTGFTYVSSNILSSNGDESATPCVNVNGIVTCELNTITPSLDDVIQIVAFSNPSTEGTTQTNVVEIMAVTELDPDSVPSNNILTEDDQDSIDIDVSAEDQANLSLTMSSDVTDPGVLESFNYTVVVSNAGPADATNVQVVNTLPTGLDFVSAVVTGGDSSESCSLAGQLLTCSMGSINAASNETITITASVQAGQEGNTLTNSAEVTEVDNSDPNSIKNNGITTEDDYAETDITIRIGPSVGPALSKSAVVSGREVSYLITLQNVGSDTLDNIVLEDDLDSVFGIGNYNLVGAPLLVQNPGTIVINPLYTGSGANIDLLDNTSTLAAGARAIVRVTVNVNIVSDMGFGLGVYSNQATVTADIPSGAELSDLSVNGNDVDPNGDDVPDEESQTVVTVENFFTILGVVFDDNGASATAHDGVQSGVEPPRAGVSVELRDENGVLIDTVTSNSDGSYFFQVPLSLVFDPGCSYADAALNNGYGYNATTGTSCVPVTHPDYGVVDLQVTAIGRTGYQWVSEGFLPNVAGTVAAGVVTDGTVEFSLDDSVSDSYFINFGSVKDSNWLSDQVAENGPNTTVFHSHSYRAFSDGIVNFAYTDLVSTPQNSSFSAILYHDINCDGSLDSSEPRITAPISIDHEVNPEICVVNRVFIPANVSHDDSYRTAITATITYSDPAGTGHGLIHSVAITDVTRAIALGEGVLVLAKYVENVTESGAPTTRNNALPDNVLRYTINFQNNGTGPITEVLVADSTPAYTTLEQPVQCPGSLPDGIVSCQVLEPSGASNLAGYEGSVQWQFVGALAAGAAGNVSFDIRIE